MLLKSFWTSHLQMMNPYSRIELVDEREYQKVQMKPTYIYYLYFIGPSSQNSKTEVMNWIEIDFIFL